MNQTPMWQDITASVHHALREHLDLLTEQGLVQRSDNLLASLPSVGGSQTPTSTAMLLRHYHVALHQEVCWSNQPRMQSATVEDELCQLTRSVILSIGINEGVSVEAAVGLALVLYKRGVIPFCALPTVPLSSA